MLVFSMALIARAAQNEDEKSFLAYHQVQEAIELVAQGHGSFSVAKNLGCSVAELMTAVNKYQASKGKQP